MNLLIPFLTCISLQEHHFDVHIFSYGTHGLCHVSGFWSDCHVILFIGVSFTHVNYDGHWRYSVKDCLYPISEGRKNFDTDVI